MSLVSGCVLSDARFSSNQDLNTASGVVLNTWVRYYGENQENTGIDILQAQEGGYYILGGTSQDKNQQGGIYLMKVDEAGEILWQKTYGGKGFDVGLAASQTMDGGIVIAGQTASFSKGDMDAYLIRVDKDGVELWSKAYGSPKDEMATSVFQTEDGGYVLVGNSVDSDLFVADPGAAGYGGLAGLSNIYVVKTDSEGNLLWSQVYESEKNMISGGLPTFDDGILVLATIMYYPQEDNDIYLMKLDNNGSELWSRVWDQEALAGYDFTSTSDGYYLISGAYEKGDGTPADLLLMKVDAEGHEIWMQKFGRPNLYEFGKSVIETSDGGYLVAGSSTASLHSGTSEIILVKVDKNGELLWMNSLGLDRQAKISAVLAAEDGGFLLTGFRSTGNQMGITVLIKTNGEGEVSGQ
jgi:hypothetical protein